MDMAKKYGRALFFIDPLRPLIPGDCPTQKNLNWIYGLFRHLLACNGVGSAKFHQFINPSFSQLQENLYGGLSYEDSLMKWASCMESDVHFEVMKSESDLVIGFELAAGLKDFLNINNHTFIDIRVHPSRYLDDLILSFYSNDRSLNALFAMNSRDWSDRPAAIAMMAGYYGRQAARILEDGTVFLAQSRHDATVIQNGKFVQFCDLLPYFRHGGAGPLYVLPHPGDPENPIVAGMVQNLGAISLIGENFYSLALTCGDAVDFLTFTSGSGREAEDFGRRIRFLGVNHYGAESLNEKRYSAMSAAIFSPHFWKHVAQGTVGSVACAPSGRVLRNSLGARWAYPF